jgi:phosphate transport system substrate-binding protein
MTRLLSACAALLLLAGPAHAEDDLLVTGAGATFPYPLYSKWFSEYQRLHVNVRFNYQSIGSGGGIQQITAGTVDFGATDAPLTKEELAKIPDAVHIPTVMGAVVVTYNAPIPELRLTPEVIADVFLGKITRWDDKALAAINPGVKLPTDAIVVAHRSDGSGTTSIFTDYLAKVSAEWKEKVGAGKSVKWPVGLGGKGNEGVTGLVKQNPGAIGYVELAYAKQNALSMATLQNKAGAWVRPSLESTTAAAAGVAMPADYRVSMTNADGPASWPIASFTYLLVRKDQKDAAKGEALVQFLWWAIHEGQKAAAPLDYAPLPRSVVQMVEQTVRELSVEGKPVSLAGTR